MGIKTHKDFDVWNKPTELVENIYPITSTFPKEELFGLTSQIRRSAISISCNITEGAVRKSKKAFTKFLYVAIGSLKSWT